MFELYIQIGIPIVLLLIGLGIGGRNERRHFQAIKKRQAQLAHIRISNLKTIPDTVQNPRLVMGQVVIASDYFKTLATSLRNLFGGEMIQAQRLLTRARSEALLRLVEQANERGLNEVYNVRFVFCNISQLRGKAGAMQVEMMAYGTAVARY